MLFSTIFVAALPFLANALPIDVEAWIQMQRRAGVDDAQLAQGLNAFFKTLNIESPCTAGQNACVGVGPAVCSPEGNWETKPCAAGLQCLAAPQLTPAGTILIGCTTEAAVLEAIKSVGGSGDVAVENGVTVLPTNIELVTATGAIPTPTATATATEVPTEVPTSTETAPADPTCTTEDDDDNDDEEPTTTFEATIGDPFPTTLTESGSVVTAPTSDPTCTAEDPEETDFPETLQPVATLIVFPNPNTPGEFITSTLSDATATETTTSTTATETTSVEVTATESATPSVIESVVITSSVNVPTITPTNGLPQLAVPAPDVNVIGTGSIPATAPSGTAPDVIALEPSSIPAKRQLYAQPDGTTPTQQYNADLLHKFALDAAFTNFVTLSSPPALSAGQPCGNQPASRCVDGQVGNCVNGIWTPLAACRGGQQCFVLPGDVSAGPQAGCTTFDEASALFAAAGVESGPFAQV